MLESISDRSLRKLAHRIRQATAGGKSCSEKFRLIRRVVGLADAESIEDLAAELDARDEVGPSSARSRMWRLR